MSDFSAVRRACRTVIALLLAPPALAAECPPVQPPKVVFKLAPARPVVRNDRPREAIAALVGAAHRKDILHNGLTQSGLGLDIVPKVMWSGIPNVKGCASLAEVEATWLQTPTTVDVASQYRPGSCEYSAVLEHENEHVRLNRRAYDLYAPRIEARLRELAASIKPVSTTEPPQRVAERIGAQLTAGIKPLTDAATQEMHRSNAAIDTPESYRALAGRCRGWMK